MAEQNAGQRGTSSAATAIGRKILVIGSGAREHALGARLKTEGHRILFAPGNAGTAVIGTNMAVAADDVAALVTLARTERVDLVVVGPEAPLTLGVVDAMAGHSVRAFGPTKAAARLEGSKAFMKAFLVRHGIRSAPFRVFEDADAADAYVREAARPLVVKADGLASGKGVVVAQSTDEALAAVDAMMRQRVHGEAGACVVIEDLLAGEEASFHVVCDGERAVPLAPSQDHKRVFDRDQGPNTGGMGAYAPAPVVTVDVHDEIMRSIVAPTLRGMAKEGMPFRGVLFIGLMIENGVPRVLEFNVRFGDPETCVIMPLYGGNLYSLLAGSARGMLPPSEAQNPDGSAPLGRVFRAPLAIAGEATPSAICVVMAADGYPGLPRAGDVISGLDVAVDSDSFVLHAATKKRADGAIVTAGGRVLTVGARGHSLAEASRRAYQAVAAIHWEGEHHRMDIGHRAR